MPHRTHTATRNAATLTTGERSAGRWRHAESKGAAPDHTGRRQVTHAPLALADAYGARRVSWRQSGHGMALRRRARPAPATPRRRPRLVAADRARARAVGGAGRARRRLARPSLRPAHGEHRVGCRA